jgi:hypothetical protein
MPGAFILNEFRCRQFLLAFFNEKDVIYRNLFSCFACCGVLADYRTIDFVVLMSGPMPTFLFSEPLWIMM